MNSTKQILVILVCLFLYTPVVAQEHQPATISRDSREVTVIIRQQQLRFAAPASAQEIRLEVFNQAGETIYDSGLVSGPEISWALRNTNGEAIPSGLYAYTLMVKESSSETPALRRGHLIVERGHDRDPQTDRLWVTNRGAVGAETAMSGGELTVSSGPETSVAGARIGRGDATRPAIDLNGLGTAGRIAKFGDRDLLVDSVITEDLNGRIGIGTQTPGSALTVAGQIETASGGIKFPDGSVQLKSAAKALFQVSHDATLAGDGTGDAPLGVAVPLSLNGSSSSAPILVIANSGSGGGMDVYSSGSNYSGGYGVRADGGRGTSGNGGIGVDAHGGDTYSSFGAPGPGVRGIGGYTPYGYGGIGVIAIGGISTNAFGSTGISASSMSSAPGSLAGYFYGGVTVNGTLSKSAGSFRIDHPLDPANKYLSHSFVESPDMMNIYNGAITTDQNGEATVTLPEFIDYRESRVLNPRPRPRPAIGWHRAGNARSIPSPALSRAA